MLDAKTVFRFWLAQKSWRLHRVGGVFWQGRPGFSGSHHYMWWNLGTSFHSGIKTRIKAREACEFTTTKKFQAIASVGKVMASVFWDKRDVIHVDFLPRGATINSEYDWRVPSDVHRHLRKKNGLVWSPRASRFSMTMHDLILLTTLRVHYSNSAGRYCHLPLTAWTLLQMISTCLDP